MQAVLRPAFVRRLSGTCPVSVRSLLGGVRVIAGWPMDDKLQVILDSLPEKPPRSRLEPYCELIDELRRRGRTYREIARILVEKCQLQVSRSTVHDFVRGRSRTKPKPAKRKTPGSAETTSVSQPAVTGRTTRANTANQGRPPVDEVQQRIAALKLRPAPEQTSPKQFHYDPSEPLRLPQKRRKNPGDKAP